MEKVTFYSQIEGISLERMERYGKFDMRINHFHNEYEIFFLIEGERQFFFNNRAYLFRKGSLTLVDTNSIHMTKATCEEEEGHDRIILYIDKNKMKELESKFPNLNLVRFFKEHYGVYDLTLEQQKNFMNFYHTLKQEFEQQGRNFKALIEMEVLQYFIHFMRESHIQTPVTDSSIDQKSSKYRTVYTIADYISEHYSESITLDSLASQFFLSRYYLSRSFKEVTGHGVNEYVNLLRIQQAKRLLEETSLSISEIAAKTGYESLTYFEKLFKKYMTLSPLKYRKTLNIVTYTNLTQEDQEL